ncbi:hypothetical protein IHO40_00355 [Wolbachia endosymbiont of Mansonella ozzardi]|nr:hypothetical protein [Wolbachia endosymbiont of Mansonella ozzardi]MCA4774640.1 hypothetical protein [Wolbachia endosymbiont of Mansonella ozzardi]
MLLNTYEVKVFHVNTMFIVILARPYRSSVDATFSVFLVKVTEFKK